MTLVLLHGEDTYRSAKKLTEIVGQYQAKHASLLNLRELEASDIRIEDIKLELSSVSMFKETKLLVIHNPFEIPEFVKEVVENKEVFLTNEVIVFLQEGKAKAASPLFKFLFKEGRVQEFSQLMGAKLASWINQESEKYGVKLPDSVVSRLRLQVGGDLWRMSNEIQKLALWSKAGEEKLDQEALDALLGRNIETEIFLTLEAAAQLKRGEAMRLLHEHLVSGESPLYLLSMVIYQFRTMLEVQDLQERGMAYNGIHPFVVRKTLPLLRKFSPEKLKRAYVRLYEIDLRSKTGEGDAEALLTHFIATV
ncbi:MAG: DNA polymerase III subunit delta [bacterium]|nr:DNA polymerase III subunit delta [bacterium]